MIPKSVKKQCVERTLKFLMICGTLLAVKIGIVAACNNTSLSSGTIPSFNKAYMDETALENC
jgi:hypothetical protein